MFRRSQIVISLLALTFAQCRATAQSTPPAKDFQQWTQIAVTAPIGAKVTFTGFGEARLGDNVTQFDEELLSGGVTFSPWRWFSAGTGYLYLHANPNLSGLNFENRLYTEFMFKAPALHGFVLSDRVRPELRWTHAPKSDLFTQRYRNRVILERPVRLYGKSYSPFFMWERFYDTSVDDWTRTRWYGGFTVLVAEKASMQLYYMRQNDQYFAPYHKNVIGVSLLLHVRAAHVRHPDE